MKNFLNYILLLIVFCFIYRLEAQKAVQTVYNDTPFHIITTWEYLGCRNDTHIIPPHSKVSNESDNFILKRIWAEGTVFTGRSIIAQKSHHMATNAMFKIQYDDKFERLKVILQSHGQHAAVSHELVHEASKKTT